MSSTMDSEKNVSVDAQNAGSSSTLTNAENVAEPFTGHAWGKVSPQLAAARAAYFKMVIPAVILVSIIMFSVFSIFWGALWKLPAHPLSGWIVNFDGGDIGQAIEGALMSMPASTISWTVIPANQFSEGISGLMEAIKDEQAWFAVAITEGASRRLEDALTTPNASYDGTSAITAFGAEARNENAYRSLLAPVVQEMLQAICLNYTTQLASSRLASATNIASLLAVAPQTVVTPVSYTVVNLIPFSQPVATAATFVGLIFLLIMGFFVVMAAHSARMSTGFARLLSLRSLIVFRLASSFVTYLILSLWYTLLNMAFSLQMQHKYGHSGVLVFWMGAWVYMLAVGLALESMVVLLQHFTPYLLITWIVANVSINLFPLEVLPRLFHYGYGAPFYNFSKLVRTVVFGAKNRVGLNFGVLIAWVAVCSTVLVLVQWNARRLEIRAYNAQKKAQGL